MATTGAVVWPSRLDELAARLLRARIAPVAVGIAAFVILFVRRPSALLSPELVREDGPIHFAAAARGLPGILEPYAGYLHVAPRLVAVVALHLPDPALVANGVTMLATAALAAYIATIVPGVLGVVLGVGVTLLPGADELSWHVTDLQWTLALFLVARLAATDRGWIDRAVVALGAFTGPFAILFAPLYLWRQRGWALAIVLAGAGVQLVMLVTHDRPPGSIRTLPDAVAVVAARGIVEPLVGMPPPPVAAALVAACVIVALLAVAIRGIPRRTLLAGGYVVAASLGAAVVGATDSVPALLSWWNGDRYFLVPGAIFAAAVPIAFVHGQPWSRRAAVALAGLLITGIARDFILPITAGPAVMGG